jgi:anti-anti-sigma regulatory factor
MSTDDQARGAGAAALWSLPEELTIYTVGELQSSWRDHLAQLTTGQTPTELLAHAVDQVDAAGLQLIISLDNALARHDRRLVLQDPSEPLVEAFQSMGLADWLQDRTQRTAETTA